MVDITPTPLHSSNRLTAAVTIHTVAATHGDLAKRLAELEEKTESLVMNH